MATQKVQPGPSGSSFDANPDKPDMGDPEFVDGRVRVMMNEVRRLIFEDGQARDKIGPLIERYAKELGAGNTEYIQTMTVAAQDAFLKARGCGTNDPNPGDPVTALLAVQIGNFIDACYGLHEGRVGGEQTQFIIDATIEDTVCLLRGLDNPQDE